MGPQTNLKSLLDGTFGADGRALRGEALLIEAPAAANGVEIGSLAYDSRAVSPGALFCCIPGERADGHDFAAEALARGAVALLVERKLELAAPQVVVDRVRAALGPLASTFYGHPSDRLQLVGVTGTNGKTTTAFLVRALLERLGVPCGLLGTVKRVVGGREEPAPRTTPEAVELNAALAEMVAAGQQACAIEVSSHALALRRTDGLRFAVAAFTNLSQDHLDFHGTMDAYFAAKRRLFRDYAPGRAVVNVGDPWGRRLACELERPLTYGLEGEAQGADLFAREVRCSATASRFQLDHPGGRAEVELSLPGRFNVANGLCALGAVIGLGVELERALPLLAQPLEVPGRMQRIPSALPFEVIVDYAHTPDSLARVLEALRELLDQRGQGRLICLFGAGGDRDRTKRAPMGRVAAELADMVVVTSDNPRGEQPQAIIDQLVEGVQGADGALWEVVVDRRSAIRHAVGLAQEGDIVLLAGKGHEQGQEFERGRVVPFDDARVARIALARRVAREGTVERFFDARQLASVCGGELAVEPPPGSRPSGFTIDSRGVAGGELFVGLPGSRSDGGAYAGEALAKGAWGALVAPGHGRALAESELAQGRAVILHPNPLAALQLLAAGWRELLTARVVGVTGSAGKTTTKQLIAELLARRLRVHSSPANWNTEIGMPLALLAAPPDSEAVVLELAMRGPGQIAELTELCDPDLGVIVNVGPVHLEQLGSVERVAQAKAELFACMRPGTVAVVPADEPLLVRHLRDDQRTVGFGPGGEVWFVERRGSEVVVGVGERELVVELEPADDHLVHNLLAAVAVAHTLGVDAGGRLQLRPEPLRFERVELGGGVTLINDCYNANPLSLRAALAALAKEPGRRLAVLGDMLELGERELDFHRDLAPQLAAAGVAELVAVGPRMAALAAVAPCPAHQAETADQAAAILKRLLKAGDVVLIKGSRALGLERVAEILRAPAPVG